MKTYTFEELPAHKNSAMWEKEPDFPVVGKKLRNGVVKRSKVISAFWLFPEVMTKGDAVDTALYLKKCKSCGTVLFVAELESKTSIQKKR